MIKNISLLCVSCFCLVSAGLGQGKCPVKKIYAYKQASLPGIKPQKPEEGGKERKETFNYWFYLTVPESKEIEIKNIWISGINFSAKTEVIEHSPVTKLLNKSASGNDVIELVPQTRRKLLLVYPTGLNQENKAVTKRVQKKIDQYELVIAFTWKGKNRFVKKKTINILEAEVLP